MQGHEGTKLRNTREVGGAGRRASDASDRLDSGRSTGYEAGRWLLDPCQRKTAFLMQHCLSQGAGVSIILPTLPRKPWYCFPKDLGTQPQPPERLSYSASECLNEDLHFRISQEH